MPNNKLLTRKRGVAGQLSAGGLGVVTRSVGYLQGGYKDTTVHSSIQLFNTITQTGSIVFDTGYKENYKSGITGNFSGYFYGMPRIKKFNYISQVMADAFTLSDQIPCESFFDLGVLNYGYALSGFTALSVVDLLTINKINLTTDTPTVVLTGAPKSATTRQALSTSNNAYMSSYGPSTFVRYEYLTNVTTQMPDTPATPDKQVPTGMSYTDNRGYICGYSGVNIQIDMVGGVFSGMSIATSYSYNFGESHSLTSLTEGFMMAGFADTTGRYGGSQHGLCQKNVLATNTIVTLADLVLPQSSGQMMQGF